LFSIQPIITCWHNSTSAHCTFFFDFISRTGPFFFWPSHRLWSSRPRMPTGLLAHCSPLLYRHLAQAEAAAATPGATVRRSSRHANGRTEPASRGLHFPSSLSVNTLTSSSVTDLLLIAHRHRLADRLPSPPQPPHPYKRCPCLRLSTPRSPLSSSPHLHTSNTFSSSSLCRRLPSSTPGHLSPSAASCQPG
jgi:hypothetical protein